MGFKSRVAIEPGWTIKPGWTGINLSCRKRKRRMEKYTERGRDRQRSRRKERETEKNRQTDEERGREREGGGRKREGGRERGRSAKGVSPLST